ncbi:AAA family ATPase [Clostridium perfringens]|nr:AAA family ATPase [Clostridium perfringens]MDM1024761.1 AAA family ATPase [Clostridium perfringens]PWX12335.1 hypothetical protein CYK69_09810 [Clostridium perfringens]PWX39158.1 hypothetical protein CYK94_05275 [Clostridium perfringens]PWX61923.1 hypothetical protein CYK88_02420 [Clostridium perfringens]
MGSEVILMRGPAVNDYWRKCCNFNHKVEIKEIDLNGINGIEKLDFKKGIFAICGLNGVGKSTVISAIKSIIGIDLNVKDNIRIFKDIDGIVTITNEDKKGDFDISNRSGNRLIDIVESENTYLYLEHEQAMEIINRINEEANFNELLEQYEEVYFSNEELYEISYIVGKEYEEVCVTEIEDEQVKIPFLKVKSNGIEYDSTKMGVGEHILFYYYIMINRLERNSLVVIEEPESCISVRSQINFMNYMAKKHAKKQIQLIVTTHSPFVIKNIPQSNIILIDRYGDEIFTFTGEEKRLTRELGLDINKKGIIYVEDKIAKQLLIRVLRDYKKDTVIDDYDIEYVKGESEITARLQSLCTEIDFKIIGVYDGDMKTRLSQKAKEKINWDYTFLPSDEELEKEFRNCVKENTNLFVEKLNKDKKDVLSVLSSNQGCDYHDWFINLYSSFKLSSDELFNILYDLWIDSFNNKEKVEIFIKELSKIV